MYCTQRAKLAFIVWYICCIYNVIHTVGTVLGRSNLPDVLVVVYDGPQLGQGADPVLGVIRSSASTYLLKEYIYLCLGGMVVLNYFPCTSVHFLYCREMEKNMQHICLFVIIIKYTIFSSKPSRWRVCSNIPNARVLGCLC